LEDDILRPNTAFLLRAELLQLQSAQKAQSSALPNSVKKMIHCQLSSLILKAPKEDFVAVVFRAVTVMKDGSFQSL